MSVITVQTPGRSTFTGTRVDTTRARTSELSAVAALRSYQTDYPDYDAEDWMNAIEGVFRASSVRAVARELANLADWSMRGIAVSREDLAKRAVLGVGSVSRAVSKLAEAGYLVVSKRPARKTSNGFTQYPNVYRLVIPEARTWDMPSWDEADAFQAYIPEADQDTPLWAEDSADASANRAYWDQINRLAGGEDTQANQTSHAWTWLDTRWITQPKGPYIAVQNLNYSDAAAEAWPESMVAICPTCKQPHMSDGLCSWCPDDPR